MTVAPTAASGPRPSPLSGRPASGRFTLVTGREGEYLFLPELYNLFEAPRPVLEALSDHRSNTFSSNLPGPKPQSQELQEFFAGFVAERSVDRLAVAPPPGHGDIKDLVLNVSQICNLDCVYCYATDLNKAKSTMSQETARGILDKVFTMSRTGLHSVKFLGGEPTFAFDTIRYVVRSVRERCAARGWASPTFVIVTNGTRVSAEMIDFFSANGFYVLVSLDGEAGIHDQLRPHLGGQPSYARACQTLEALVASNVDVAVESVYTHAHYQAGVTVCGLVDHFRRLGVREMQITLALGTWHGSDTCAEIEEVTEDFAAAARSCIRSLATTDPFLLRGIHFVLDGFVKQERRKHVCGAGRTFMAVNYDGEAFPCYLLESAQTSYGVIGKSWDQDKYLKISRSFYQNGKDYHETCRNCWANEICQSCLGSTFLIEKEIAKPPAWFCGVQKTLISSVLGEIGDQLRDGPSELFLRNLEHFIKPRSRPVAILPVEANQSPEQAKCSKRVSSG